MLRNSLAIAEQWDFDDGKMFFQRAFSDATLFTLKPDGFCEADD